MDILSLELHNFGPIERTFINLSEKGLVNIEGENRDDPSANSNGSGKSTLADGLYWTLFGETARGVSGDDVIANFAGKDCYGAVILRDGEDRYMVERWRKKKGFKGKSSGLALTRTDAAGAVVDLTDGTDKLTQAKVETVLGCSHEVFVKAVYSGQEALPNLPAMTDKQIKELIEEAAGIEILAAAYTLAREHARKIDAAQAERSRDLMEAERRHTEARGNADALKGRRDAWGGERLVRQSARQKELDAAVEAAKSTASEIGKIDLSALEASRDALRASVSGVEAEKVEERRLSGELSSARAGAARAQSVFENTMNAVRRARVAFEQVEAKVGTPCGECGKEHTAADVAGVRKIAGEKLKEVTEEARKLKGDLEAEKSFVAEAEARLNAYRAAMTDVSAAMDEIAQLDREIAQHSRLTAILTSQKATVVQARANLDATKAETNPYETMVDDAIRKVGDLWAEVVKAGEAIKAGEAEQAVAQAAVKTFGPAGVRAYVLDTVTPYLNERTSHYLGTLSDGRIEAVWTTLAKNAKGELMERFAIEVEKVGGGRSFKALSGGEKRKVRLACALALQDLVASRATKPISLWIGDEIDDALDESGLERLMIVLEEKAREKGTVLVISHNSLRDWIRETVTVTMEGGKSTVGGSLV